LAILDFTILGLVNLFTPDRAQTVLGMKCLALSVRLILFLGALGFCAIRFLIVLLITGAWRALLATGTPIPLAVFEYKPSYEWSTKLSLIDLVLGVSS
jgi:hypothetical protein